MWIRAKHETVISGVKVWPGVGNYDLDHKDPTVAMQLRIMRDETQAISFGELLEGDRVKELFAKVGNADLIELNKKQSFGLNVVEACKANNWVDTVDKASVTDKQASDILYFVANGRKNAPRINKPTRRTRRKRNTDSGSGELPEQE